VNNPAALAQLRKGFDAQIAMSPDVVTGSRLPMIDDGFGGTVPDPAGTPVPFTIEGRLSHERNGVNSVHEVPSGLDTALSLFLQWRWNVTVKEGEVITARGRQFRVGVVDPIKKFGGVYCNQAPLYPAGAV